jgi:predicted TIM-barrel fold metal-dependent hydrolase
MLIDTLCDLPTYEGLHHLMAEIAFKKDLRGYLDAYGAAIARSLRVDPKDFREQISQDDSPKFMEWIEPRLEKLAMGLGDFIRFLEGAGVKMAVLYHFDEETTTGYKGPSNDFYAQLVQKAPGHLMAYAAADPHKGAEAVRELERTIKELGLHGLAVRPFMHRIRADDHRYFPLYAKCAELKVPVWIHTSINFTHTSLLDFGRPIYLDAVACAFPKLKIIAGHGGWPWVGEMAAVAWKHPNIYLDFATVRPSYMVRPGSGWEPLFQYGNHVIQRKVLFASTWMLLGLFPKVLADEVRALALKPETIERWLGKNAVELFRIE